MINKQIAELALNRAMKTLNEKNGNELYFIDSIKTIIKILNKRIRPWYSFQEKFKLNKQFRHFYHCDTEYLYWEVNDKKFVSCINEDGYFVTSKCCTTNLVMKNDFTLRDFKNYDCVKQQKEMSIEELYEDLLTGDV